MDCITILSLYCNLGGWKAAGRWLVQGRTVLQSKGKIVLQPVGLYCNRKGLEAGSSVLQYTALYCNLKGLGKAGLYCDTVPSQATIRPRGAQAAGVGAHWARNRRRRGRGAYGAGGWAGRARPGRAGSWAAGARAGGG